MRQQFNEVQEEATDASVGTRIMMLPPPVLPLLPLLFSYSPSFLFVSACVSRSFSVASHLSVSSLPVLRGFSPSLFTVRCRVGFFHPSFPLFFPLPFPFSSSLSFFPFHPSLLFTCLVCLYCLLAWSPFHHFSFLNS